MVELTALYYVVHFDHVIVIYPLNINHLDPSDNYSYTAMAGLCEIKENYLKASDNLAEDIHQLHCTETRNRKQD